MDPFEVYHELLNKDILFYEGWKSIYTGTYQYYGLVEPCLQSYYHGRIIGIMFSYQYFYSIYYLSLLHYLYNI